MAIQDLPTREDLRDPIVTREQITVTDNPAYVNPVQTLVATFPHVTHESGVRTLRIIANATGFKPDPNFGLLETLYLIGSDVGDGGLQEYVENGDEGYYSDALFFSSDGVLLRHNWWLDAAVELENVDLDKVGEDESLAAYLRGEGMNPAYFLADGTSVVEVALPLILQTEVGKAWAEEFIDHL